MAPGREKRARSPSEEHFEPLKKDRGSEKEPEATPTALVEAAADGDLSLVKSLISKGIDVNSGCEYKLGYSSYENVTAVVAAMEHNHESVVQFLLDSGAELRPLKRSPGYRDKNREEEPLLHRCIYKKWSVSMMDRLLDSGHCNINEIYHGRTPLHQSVETLRWEDSDATALHRLLAQPGIDLLGGQHAVLGTPLHLAAYGAYHDNKAVEILLTAGADPSVAANVVILGDSIPPEVLCPGAADAAGADIHAQCEQGFTPLMIAVLSAEADLDVPKERVLEMIRALIAAGSDVNARRDHWNDSQRCGPLYYALRDAHYNPEVFDVLVEAGADPALAAPSLSQLVAAVVALPEYFYGFDYHRICARQGVQLFRHKIRAVARGGLDLATAINPETGQLVLLDVEAEGNAEVVLALVAEGANAAARDEEGRTALQLLLDEDGSWDWETHGMHYLFNTVTALIKAGDLDSWDAIPKNFWGLESLLGYIYEKAPEKLSQLLSKCKKDVQESILEALLTLNRLLPGGEGLAQIRFKILAQAFEYEFPDDVE